MLFVQPQDVVYELKLYEIRCMTRNFTPDVHGEVHIRHLDTMQHGTDGPNNTPIGLVRIGIKFYSEMSVAYALNQTIVRDVFGGSVVRQNNLRHTVQRVQQGGGSLMFWGGIMWGRRTTLVVMKGAEAAIRYRNGILRPIVQPYLECWRGILLNERQFSPSSCTSCE